ncbi:hypothetical protein TIFTF001_017072 [Ficus carica]|uniref:Ubiquitin-like protease family profile domain-containing protein n=1 Tax=Ficus carica TaxID=3494 RepID=A0AA88A4A6_FICCA|nr:hypothetical protein TIFTF001_017072 [Ficus carica]
MEHSKKGRARRRNPMDPTVEGKRRATIMKRVHMATKRGERIQVTFDEKGQPEGKHDGLKEIIWKETVTSFNVEESFRNTCLKSCGEAARNFRYDLYKTFVEEFINEESVWTRPKKVIDNYPNIEEDDWIKFVQYRTSSQFQQLSDRGSEIRTNNEYSSRGGRDGYRKLDQEMFKKTGKWERRDGLWLEQQMGPDGELKNPACKKVGELIVEYNTQESQGTFESVGTNDVLSQALSRPEHKGRVRGQSKFVKPSQYFNLSRSSNKDNEVQSMRREIEELKALVRGLCANRDVEPSVDPKNVPTVDQHNSFKASCSAQEKQDGVAEPPTMPVDSQECKLYIFDEVQGGQLLVAFGRVWLKSLPTDTVHGIPLGEGNVRVLVELDMSMNKASRGPSHVPDPAAGNKKCQKRAGNKMIDSRTEVQQGAQEQKLVFDFNNINRAMRHLAYYAHSSMRQGNQIEVPIPYTIMSFDMPVFLSFEDIYEFINLQEISANCILFYMRYLEELCRINGQAEKFVFVSPSLISPVRTDTEDAGRRERADNLLSFLRDAPKERLYLVPHNRERHWVLGVIDPWEDLVLYFDPLREKKRDDFTELMNMALTDWKITTGEGIRRRRDCKTKISNRTCPLQEGSVECGYFILGFMRDIVLNGIDALESKQFYTSEDLDLIRGEWSGHSEVVLCGRSRSRHQHKPPSISGLTWPGMLRVLVWSFAARHLFLSSVCSRLFGYGRVLGEVCSFGCHVSTIATWRDWQEVESSPRYPRPDFSLDPRL